MNRSGTSALCLDVSGCRQGTLKAPRLRSGTPTQCFCKIIAGEFISARDQRLWEIVQSVVGLGQAPRTSLLLCHIDLAQFLQCTSLLKNNIMVAPDILPPSVTDLEGVSKMAGLAPDHEKAATLLLFHWACLHLNICLMFSSGNHASKGVTRGDQISNKYEDSANSGLCVLQAPLPLATKPRHQSFARVTLGPYPDCLLFEIIYILYREIFFLAHIKCKVAMTQFKADHFTGSEKQASLPPICMDWSLAVPLSSLKYVYEQLGGGCRQATPPELTPTRLRSRIRATSRDAGVVKQASIRRAHQQPSGHSPAPSGTAASSSFLDNALVSNDTSSRPMPPLHSRHGSPYLGEPILRLPSHPASDRDSPCDRNTASLTFPAPNEQRSSPSGGDLSSQETPQIQDVFYGHSVNVQPAWMGQNIARPFDSTYDVPNVPSRSHDPTSCDTSRLVPPLNIIPPTPSKDIHSDVNQSAKAASPQLDLSYYPDGRLSHSHFPEESTSDDCANSQKPSMMGQRSWETNILLEEGFTGIELHGVNYWNIYVNYFKENMEKEVARLTEDETHDTEGKGKGKEVCRPDMQGTPSTRLRTRCYEKFKDTFPDAYQDILDMFDEAAVLGATTQTISQHGQSFQRLCKKVAGILDSLAARFGFEAAVVLCGKIVNQDASLSHVHTTPSAGGFFETRCRANDDTIIAHIKAHVFNTTLLSAVKESFNVDDSNGVESSLRDDTSDIQILEGNTSKSKAIGGLMQKEISALVDALKAGMMVVVKVSAKFQAAIIASEVPVIFGEAPPSDYLHPGACHMFADGHTDFNGPSWAKPTTAATKVKKVQKGHNTRPISQQDEPHDEVRSLPQMTGPPPSRPFVMVTKPLPHPAPPPSRPFVMATKPTMLDVISIPTSDSEEELLEKPDDGKGKKRKLKFAAVARTLKKHAPSAEAVKDTKGEMKGGPTSPLTVGSSSDEPLAPAAPASKRLRNVNGSHYVEGCALRKVYHEVDSEDAVELAANDPACPVMVADGVKTSMGGESREAREFVGPNSDDPSVLVHTSQTEPLNTMADQVGPASPHAVGHLSPRRPTVSQNHLRNDPRNPLDSRELHRLRDHPHRHYSHEVHHHRDAYPPLLERDGLQLWNAPYN
ncbi:hypothetical protein C8R48DRAFT_674628 [Suillus tomentosus]|nr:hypothetical protein C8R48DRAFT_674628 [Suillus tomentosus]